MTVWHGTAVPGGHRNTEAGVYVLPVQEEALEFSLGVLSQRQMVEERTANGGSVVGGCLSASAEPVRKDASSL